LLKNILKLVFWNVRFRRFRMYIVETEQTVQFLNPSDSFKVDGLNLLPFNETAEMMAVSAKLD